MKEGYASDLSMVAMFDVLADVLHKKGILDRAELLQELRSAAERWKNEGMDKNMLWHFDLHLSMLQGPTDADTARLISRPTAPTH